MMTVLNRYLILPVLGRHSNSVHGNGSLYGWGSIMMTVLNRYLILPVLQERFRQLHARPKGRVFGRTCRAISQACMAWATRDGLCYFSLPLHLYPATATPSRKQTLGPTVTACVQGDMAGL